MKNYRSFRIILVLAGVYNLAWGLFSSLFPQWLFTFAEMPLSNHPELFQCLAMVVGVYGLLYLEAARKPEGAFPIVAVGMLGKLLGPVGWLQLYCAGQWPLKSILLILTNDIIWWLPFAYCLKLSAMDYLASWKKP